MSENYFKRLYVPFVVIKDAFGVKKAQLISLEHDYERPARMFA